VQKNNNEERDEAAKGNGQWIIKIDFGADRILLNLS
jgi:hypothetical protein